MTVLRNRPSCVLRLGQQAYLERILQDHKTTDFKAGRPSMKTQHLETAKPTYQLSDKFRVQYQLAVGSFIYAILGTRPDLVYSVFVVSCYTSRPNNSH